MPGVQRNHRGCTEGGPSGELRYARAKDKSDKSIDAYKFYINALYVATTRAVRSLYLVEQDRRQGISTFLASRTPRILSASHPGIVAETGSVRPGDLELQGKREQAELIGRTCSQRAGALRC